MRPETSTHPKFSRSAGIKASNRAGDEASHGRGKVWLAQASGITKVSCHLRSVAADLGGLLLAKFISESHDLLVHPEI